MTKKSSYLGGNTLVRWHWFGHDGKISQKLTKEEKTRIKQGWDDHAQIHGLKPKQQPISHPITSPFTPEEITAMRKRIRARQKGEQE